MVKTTAQIFALIAPELVAEQPPKENVKGFYDVKFCLGRECYLMVSVDKITKKVKNFWWQVDCSPKDEEAIMYIQHAQHCRLASLAEAVCAKL